MQILATLGLDWQLILAQMVNFAILLGILSFLVYKPLLRAIDDRRERIAKSMEDAKTLEKRTRDMEKERAQRLQEIDKEAREFLDAAKKQAEESKVQMLDEARKEVEQVIAKGRTQLESERRKLLEDIQSTVTSLSIDLASKVLEREFTDKDQERMLASLEKQIPSLIK